MRTLTALGDSWRYVPRFDESFLEPSFDIAPWGAVDLPHTNLELPYNDFDEKTYQFVSTYARELELPALADGKRAILEFEGVMAACDLWVNGVHSGGHVGGYTPFAIDITAAARPGANRLVLRVDSTERADIPPFGHVIDYLCYGGVYRGVFLKVAESARLSDAWASPIVDRITSGGGRGKRLEVELEAAGEPAGLEARLVLSERATDGGARRPIKEARASFGPDGKARAVMEGLDSLRLWDLDDPALYDLDVTLVRGDVELDSARQRVGFRSAEWRPDGFFLNGRLVKLAGLNRHQSWPYSGYAMPARVQRRDAEILKRELGVNIVRTSHYPQAKAFLDACDELGLLVFEELPGWQHVGDGAWKDNACAALEEMILRDRSRASIVLWGVRVNESKDDHDFYARTNEIAHRLDPTRARGGVRYIQKSELLEDVYTFNDFIHNGITPPLRKQRSVTGLRRWVPYLVTEHDGHMYPTKRFDNEERLAEHALRHARVLDAMYGDPHVSGAIGWCAFDYNTHKDFGSGDRICYHGVSDMFRIPKYAAAVYSSQRDASSGVVMEAASLFSKGERSAARVLPIEIYTNCDEVVLYRGGKKIGAFLPDRKRFPSLPHPPVVVTDLVGDQLSETDFSPRDQGRIKDIVGKILTIGLESLSVFDMLSMGLLLFKNKLSMQDGENLMGQFVLGWGSADESWELVGIVGGKEVARRRYGGDSVATRLLVKADDEVLLSGGGRELASGEPLGEAWDATRVEVRLVDQYGNLCPFAADSVDLEVSGPGRILGPTRMPLMGGCLAFWVRTTGKKGRLDITVRSARVAAAAIAVTVE